MRASKRIKKTPKPAGSSDLPLDHGMQVQLLLENFILRNELLRIKTLLAQARSEAAKDPLTGLANRRSFEVLATRKVIRAQTGEVSFALLVIDANYFKQVNDTFGHPIGDALLVAMAEALQVRPDDLVARLGGDEFVILATNVTLEVVVKMAERLCESIARIQILEAPGIEPSISIGGIVGCPKGNLKSLITLADQQLYRAKEFRGTDIPAISIIAV